MNSIKQKMKNMEEFDLPEMGEKAHIDTEMMEKTIKELTKSLER
jgi:hypothetical protein